MTALVHYTGTKVNLGLTEKKPARCDDTRTGSQNGSTPLQSGPAPLHFKDTSPQPSIEPASTPSTSAHPDSTSPQPDLEPSDQAMGQTQVADSATLSLDFYH